jgi:hypothetical protein
MQQDAEQQYIDFEDLVTGTRKVTVQVVGKTIEVDYDPNAYDDALQIQFQKIFKLPDEHPERVKFANVVIYTLVRGWNLRDRDGQMMPINPDTVSRMGIPIRSKISGAVMEDIWGSVQALPKSDATSSTGLLATVNGVEHPAGSSFSTPGGS